MYQSLIIAFRSKKKKHRTQLRNSKWLCATKIHFCDKWLCCEGHFTPLAFFKHTKGYGLDSRKVKPYCERLYLQIYYYYYYFLWSQKCSSNLFLCATFLFFFSGCWFCCPAHTTAGPFHPTSHQLTHSTRCCFRTSLRHPPHQTQTVAAGTS